MTISYCFKREEKKQSDKKKIKEATLLDGFQ